MAVPLLDLTRQYTRLQQDIEEAALRVLRSGRYILGPENAGLEQELSAYVGVDHTVALSSGTDALLAALMALDVGPGDKVALPVYTFFATAGVVARLGAQPVFVDVEPRFLTMDPKGLEAAIEQHPDIKAAIVVHLFGAVADMRALDAILAPRGIPLVEDACQAIGSHHDGTKAGAFGVCGCFSTFPSKNLGGPGDGGFLTARDAAFATRVRQLRNHGQSDTYRHERVGGNFRLDELQCAVLRVKLRHIDAMNAERRANAARYRALFADEGVHAIVRVPEDQPGHTYHQYVTHLRGVPRDRVRKTLTDQGIGCAVYYPIPLHEQPCFAHLGYAAGDFPVAEEAARTNLALPIYPELREDEAGQVAAAMASAVRAK
ncbi:MAG: DegT/DnrJ/EryC1/StrS family aminotransferase [Planctomycetota bacterium]